MSSPADLRRQGDTDLARADQCDDLADDLDRRRAVIGDRFGLIVERHTAAVWASMAADNSRRTMHLIRAYGIPAVTNGLALTATELRDRADDLRVSGWSAHADADELAAALEAAALEPSAASTAPASAPPSTPTPIGPWGIR